MKLFYSKGFIAFDILLAVLFITGLFLDLPLWIKILLFVPLMEYTFHEYIHAFVAWLHNVKIDSITMNHSRMCCKLVPLSIDHPYKNKIYARVILAGGLFQSAIYSFEVTILILSAAIDYNIIPLMIAGFLIFRYIFYDILPLNCDIRRIFDYSILCGKSQRLSPSNS